MNRQDGFGALSDLLLDFVWIYVKCFLIGIRKNGQRLLVKNSVVGGNKCIGRYNYLIACIHTQHMPGPFQGPWFHWLWQEPVWPQ